MNEIEKICKNLSNLLSVRFNYSIDTRKKRISIIDSDKNINSTILKMSYEGMSISHFQSKLFKNPTIVSITLMEAISSKLKNIPIKLFRVKGKIIGILINNCTLIQTFFYSETGKLSNYIGIRLEIWDGNINKNITNTIDHPQYYFETLTEMISDKSIVSLIDSIESICMTKLLSISTYSINQPITEKEITIQLELLIHNINGMNYKSTTLINDLKQSLGLFKNYLDYDLMVSSTSIDGNLIKIKSHRVDYLRELRIEVHKDLGTVISLYKDLIKITSWVVTSDCCRKLDSNSLSKDDIINYIIVISLKFLIGEILSNEFNSSIIYSTKLINWEKLNIKSSDSSAILSSDYFEGSIISSGTLIRQLTIYSTVIPENIFDSSTSGELIIKLKDSPGVKVNPFFDNLGQLKEMKTIQDIYKKFEDWLIKFSNRVSKVNINLDEEDVIGVLEKLNSELLKLGYSKVLTLGGNTRNIITLPFNWENAKSSSELFLPRVIANPQSYLIISTKDLERLIRRNRYYLTSILYQVLNKYFPMDLSEYKNEIFHLEGK